ncbi:iron chaperone [Streptomyces sp. NPDC017254]|uniref:iron chaperone n=1 Tax=unclassified Streptomyces TaxID=2593676 RepID=UPI0037B79DB1
MPSTRSSVESTDAEAAEKSGSGEKYDGFTSEERDAMKERAKELKSTARRGSRSPKADGETEVRAKIAEMADADRVLAERIHEIVKAHAPGLAPKLWYGMPSYARDGKVVCFFQSAQKFKSRYATLGFSDLAQLDDGAMWATSYALTELTADDEARIAALVEKAASAV